MSKLCWAALLALGASAQDAKHAPYRVHEKVFRGKQPTKAEIAGVFARRIKKVLDLRCGPDLKLVEQQALEAPLLARW